MHARCDSLQSRLDVLSGTLSSSEGGGKNTHNQPEIMNIHSDSVGSQSANKSESMANFQTIDIPYGNVAHNVLQPNEAIRVVFILQHLSVWPGWRSVWDAAKNDPRFHTKIVLTPFRHPFSSEALTYDDVRQFLISENIPFNSAEYFDLNAFRPHVVFVQNPYEETRPQSLQIERINSSGARVAYIPYGLEMGGGAWNIAAQFDTVMHRSAWRIFARSERHKKMFGKYCRAGNDHVVVTGHPKFDLLVTDIADQLPATLAEKIAQRKVVLWTPHFSVGDPPTWSTYKLYSEFILAEMARRVDLFLLIRPHPMFFQAMQQHSVLDEDGEQKFRRMINESSNMALDENSDHRLSFSVSDALMTDVGSFLLEYLPTGKPLLYLHHPDGLGMNDDRDLVRYLYTATGSKDIAKFMDMVTHSEDPQKSEREAVLPEFLFGLDTNVGENISQHIYTAISAGDIGSPTVSPATTEQMCSENYWKDASDTYLAPADYYDTKEAILNDLLARLPPFKNAIDIGCGDGRYTFLLAKNANTITGYDISPSLTEQAVATAAAENISNVRFVTQELETIAPFEKYDLVACMGVTSCIFMDTKFLSFLDKLKMLSRNGGHLLLIDTLSSAQEQVATDQNGYIAKYRSISDYRALIARRGYVLQEEILIKEISERKLVNKLFLFEFNEPGSLTLGEFNHSDEIINSTAGT